MVKESCFWVLNHNGREEFLQALEHAVKERELCEFQALREKESVLRETHLKLGQAESQLQDSLTFVQSPQA